MNTLGLVAFYLAYAVRYLWFFFQVAGIVLGVWALVDCVRRPAEHFALAGKRSKNFWLGLNLLGLIIVAVMGAASMFGLLGFVANAVYLVDVRVALNYYKPVRVRAQMRSRSPRNNNESDWRR